MRRNFTRVNIINHFIKIGAVSPRKNCPINTGNRLYPKFSCKIIQSVHRCFRHADDICDLISTSKITNVIRVPEAAKNGLNNFTTEFWIKAVSGVYGTVLSGANGTNFNEMIYYINAGKISPHITISSYVSDDIISDDAWHHTAMTRAGDIVKLYIDGVLVDTHTMAVGALSINSGGLVIGQDQDSVGGGFEPIDSF